MPNQAALLTWGGQDCCFTRRWIRMQSLCLTDATVTPIVAQPLLTTISWIAALCWSEEKPYCALHSIKDCLIIHKSVSPPQRVGHTAGLRLLRFHWFPVLICAVFVNNRQPGSLAGMYLATGHLKVLKTFKKMKKKGHCKWIIWLGINSLRADGVVRSWALLE